MLGMILKIGIVKVYKITVHGSF